MNSSVGRSIFGLTVTAFGICALVWHNVDNWVQLKAVFPVSHSALAIYTIAGIEIIGGLALQWKKSARGGAIALGLLYVLFALLDLPFIIRHPLVYNDYGNFFEQCSFVAAAMMLCALAGSTIRVGRIGYYLFGLCVFSFALEQGFYLRETAALVPKMIPLGQMFWAVATTAAFVVAAIALLLRIRAVLAARALGAMLLAFALLVWLPAIVVGPHVFTNWTEGLETVAIAATAWIACAFGTPSERSFPW